MTLVMSHIGIPALWRVDGLAHGFCGTLLNVENAILRSDESGESEKLLNISLFGEGGLENAVIWSQHMTEKVLDPTGSLRCPAEVGPDDGLQLATNAATHGKSAKRRGYRRHGAKRGGNKGHPGRTPVVNPQRGGAR